MKELIRSNDAFRLSLMRQLLQSHDIEVVVLDKHTGSLYSGLANINIRLMVPEGDFERARAIIREAEKDD